MDAHLFFAALLGFVLSFVGCCLSVGTGSQTWYRLARFAMGLAVILGCAALGVRWQTSGHPPLSNMYESLVTLATFLGGATFLFTWNRPIPLAEGGSAVLAVLMIGISSLFPREAAPLVPALQSYWLPIHVAIAFLGESCFALAFALGYLYCLRRLLESTSGADGDPVAGSEKRLAQSVVWGSPLGFLALMGFVLSKVSAAGDTAGKQAILLWVLPPAGVVLVLLLVALVFKREAVAGALDRYIPPGAHLDEYVYRAVALGFPLFTVGALIFGMVWAQKAWGRYWGWDPKETWALITFLVYSAYLHLRLGKGWRGTWLAGLAVFGFLVTLFTLFGVNLLLSGLHSYAMGS